MEWKHIMDKQPFHGQSIIQIDAPYGGHYAMGMRNYYQTCSWDEFLNYNKESDMPNPDFWWIAAEDFPFPDKKKPQSSPE